MAKSGNGSNLTLEVVYAEVPPEETERRKRQALRVWIDYLTQAKEVEGLAGRGLRARLDGGAGGEGHEPG